MNKTLVVIYDSITNSVFQSQVLAPLYAQLDAKTLDHVTLVTYERTKPDTATLNKRIPPRNDLSVIILKRPPFLGIISLWLGIPALKKLIATNSFTSILARGPLAGWIVLKCTPLAPVTIQARGLCAEEYRYANQESCPWWKKPKYNLMYRAYEKIEQTVYGTRMPVTIEVVSNALAQYLTKHFGTPTSSITLATKDIPAVMNQETITAARTRIRERLNIPTESIVYCYSGSYKPWQCADETIAYFIETYGSINQTILLILTPDIAPFEAALKKHNLDASRYRVCNAPAHEVTQYLAAADAGFLFRHPDVINWVSRPTKMLEYQAVGLKIIHNSTVGCLVEHT